jgi:hypothetical protein
MSNEKDKDTRHLTEAELQACRMTTPLTQPPLMLEARYRVLESKLLRIRNLVTTDLSAVDPWALIKAIRKELDDLD